MHINLKLYTFVALVCLLYGFFISLSSLVFQNISSFSFICILTYLCFLIFKHDEGNRNYLHEAIYLTLIIHLGIILGVFLSSFFLSGSNVLWVVDSHDIHIPGSLKIANLLNGTSDSISRSSIYDRTYISHIFGGIFFWIFGKNQFSSSLSLIISKIITVYFIFKTSRLITNERNSFVACLIYISMPTILFYTLVFYKEASVQMLVSILAYLLISLTKKFNIVKIVTLIFVLAVLANERHYLFPCFSLAILIYLFLDDRISKIIKFLALIAACLSYLIFTSVYHDIGFNNLVESLRLYRQLYNGYSDVNSINSSLPYPISVLKLYFTPFFNTYKLENFANLSSLLTWGSFSHQLFMVFFSISLIYIFKDKKKRLLAILLVLPFLFFLLVFGYIAPYNGRLRDSFYPIFIVLFAVNFNEVFFALKKQLHLLNRFSKNNDFQ